MGTRACRSKRLSVVTTADEKQADDRGSARKERKKENSIWNRNQSGLILAFLTSPSLDRRVTSTTQYRQQGESLLTRKIGSAERKKTRVGEGWRSGNWSKRGAVAWWKSQSVVRGSNLRGGTQRRRHRVARVAEIWFVLIRVTWILSGCVFTGDEPVPDRYAAGWQHVQPVLRAESDHASDHGPGGSNRSRQPVGRGAADGGDAAEDATYRPPRGMSTTKLHSTTTTTATTTTTTAWGPTRRSRGLKVPDGRAQYRVPSAGRSPQSGVARFHDAICQSSAIPDHHHHHLLLHPVAQSSRPPSPHPQPDLRPRVLLKSIVDVVDAALFFPHRFFSHSRFIVSPSSRTAYPFHVLLRFLTFPIGVVVGSPRRPPPPRSNCSHRWRRWSLCAFGKKRPVNAVDFHAVREKKLGGRPWART